MSIDFTGYAVSKSKCDTALFLPRARDFTFQRSLQASRILMSEDSFIRLNQTLASIVENLSMDGSDGSGTTVGSIGPMFVPSSPKLLMSCIEVEGVFPV